MYVLAHTLKDAKRYFGYMMVKICLFQKHNFFLAADAHVRDDTDVKSAAAPRLPQTMW